MNLIGRATEDFNLDINISTYTLSRKYGKHINGICFHNINFRTPLAACINHSSFVSEQEPGREFVPNNLDLQRKIMHNRV